MSLATTTNGIATTVPNIATKNAAVMFHSIIKNNAADMYHSIIAKHAADNAHNIIQHAHVIMCQSIHVNVAAVMFQNITINTHANHNAAHNNNHAVHNHAAQIKHSQLQVVVHAHAHKGNLVNANCVSYCQTGRKLFYLSFFILHQMCQFNRPLSKLLMSLDSSSFSASCTIDFRVILT